jgi:cysteine synthase A
MGFVTMGTVTKGYVPARLRDLDPLIGKTPLLQIECRVRRRTVSIFAKLESGNFSGSIKDRMARQILVDAYTSGALRSGDTIVEATSGNTGIGFAALGAALGHPVRIYMPDWMSAERVALIRSFGAEIVPVSREAGGFKGSIEQAEAFAARYEGCFLPRQFENESNTEAHRTTTAPELVLQLAAQGRLPTAFVAGVGTGGTAMGCATYLREAAPACSVHPLEPSNSPTLRTGRCVGRHRIQGISDEFVPKLVDLYELDAIVDVDDGEAIVMAQRLARELGLSVGISSGANFVGALKLAIAQRGDSAVATVFPDCARKYASTDLGKQIVPDPERLSGIVELLDFRVTPVTA